MNPNPSVDTALLRADLWRILALAFNTPIPETLDDLQELSRNLAGTLGAAHPLHPGLTELGRSMAALDPAALEHEYNALFSMDVMIPAYEGSYQRIERGAVVGDVAGYYAAFGLNTADHSGPPDSLWNELAFMAWLSLKEAYAIEHGTGESWKITREAMAEFLQDHLGRWVGAFSKRLLATTGNPLYVNAAHLLLATVSLVADELDVGEIQPLEVREHPDEPEAVTCPVGGSCKTSE